MCNFDTYPYSVLPEIFTSKDEYDKGINKKVNIRSSSEMASMLKAVFDIIMCNEH